MNSDISARPVSKKILWAGYVASGLAVLGLLFSGTIKVIQPADAKVVEEFDRLGYPERLVAVIGIIEIACTIVYLIPQTALFGAILLTAYLGGATATHVRLEENFIPPVIVGILVWLGLVLRDVRLRALLPLRR